MGADLDDDVAGTCAEYLALADSYEPGLVRGLYLQGSLALGDYHPGTSDIDFVAVVSRPPQLRALEAIHADLRRTRGATFFDGLYVNEGDLARDPDGLPDGPAVHEWRVDPASRFERNLVTWHVLHQGGTAVRGPADLDIHTDWPALAEQTRANLAGYWTGWRARTALGLAGVGEWNTCWSVLGVARLRHTLAAGRVTSKSEAAGFALETYEERWHRVIREALRIRRGEGRSLYRNPVRRHADVVGFMTRVLRSEEAAGTAAEQ
ncbi:nucleotidyltransferase domain-containing protein [Winogradskya consettensis]|uniref:nucleotidyltransferase domain-containing protein n=1 Tax=Winogradskya consettensis TaxID=113560 RepID=UPI001BB39E49|nr:nucleotidyltransferase domain-containing protein [Actinoplanes consettensis]